eukprot:8233556-Alexandrium_andersonii.AAC.1
MRRAIDPPSKIVTANGETEVSEEVMLKIPTLGSYVWATVMAESPSLLSLGALCKKNLFGFIWAPGEEAPILLTPQEGVGHPRRAVQMQ